MADRSRERTLELRKAAAERSRRRHRRTEGELRRSRTLCAFCDSYYFAALGVCDCEGARKARRAPADTATVIRSNTYDPNGAA
jgi:hypothetical protein